MRYDFLAEPVSDEMRAGPDLEEMADSTYTTYVMLAGGRLPARFFQDPQPGSDRAGAPFDKSSIDLDSETASIAALLQRSRDIRLLTLDARFHILAGDIIGFAEAIEGIATIVETFWDEFHPLPFDDGDLIMRTNCVEGLVDYAQIILPLQHALLAKGERVRPVTYRHYLLEMGKLEPRAGEERVPMDAIERSLSTEAAIPYVEATYKAVDTARKALERIRSVFIERAGYESAPKFTELSDMLDGILQVVGRGLVEDPAIAPGATDPDDSASTFAASSGGAAPAIATMAAASASLQAAEAFFLQSEASSPALVLIHQARMLVGRPLVEALESLLPENASKAVFRFESGPFPFEIDLSRMRTVTEDLLSTSTVDEAAPFNTPVPLPTGREEAGRLLQGVEHFFRTSEPSSPIPVLLARARSFINKDFNSILAELMPERD